jgi:hypothetical protein
MFKIGKIDDPILIDKRPIKWFFLFGVKKNKSGWSKTQW